MGMLQKFAIWHALKKPAGATIVLGDGENDVEAVFVGFGNGPMREYRLLQAEDKGYVASHLFSNSERFDCCLTYSFCKGLKLNIRHWSGSVEIDYMSASKYLWGTFSLLGKRAALIERFKQSRYDRSLRVRDDRTEILQLVVDEHLRRRSKEGAPVLGTVKIDKMEVFQLLYGERVWGHPRSEELFARLDLIVDSLIVSGDLREEDHRLIVSGKSVETISSNVAEDRKHRDQVGYNNAIKWLTVGLLVTAIAQVWVAYSKSQ